MNIAKLDNVTKDFGGLRAVSNLNFTVGENQILGLIGPNGSGKTTVFNLMSGVYKLTSGEIYFLDKAVANNKPHVISNMGMTRTFQHTCLCGGMTVLENVALGGYSKSEMKMWEAVGSRKKYLSKKNELTERCIELLNFMGLDRFKNEDPNNLSYGHQKLLGVSIALASQPKLLLMDEPAAGLNPTETLMLINIMEKIKAMGTSIVLVEHDMKLVMGICQRIVAINFGTKIAEGTPEEICNHPEVIKAYLGD